METEGLYIVLTQDGKIKRHLSTIMGEVPLDDTTIADELIQFSDKCLADNIEKHAHELWDMAQNIEKDPMIYMAYREVLLLYIHTIHTKEPVHATLIQTKLEDELSPDIDSPSQLKENFLKAIVCLTAVNTAQILTNHVLNSLCRKQQINAKTRHVYLHRMEVATVFTLEDTLNSQYLFRSEDKYYYFLLQRFIASKPNVAKCQYCGRFFIPKTRKKTLYCDRIIKDGKTCKQIAPHLNRKERAATDRVISEYNRVKDMLMHRIDRAEYDKRSSPIDLSREEFYQWLEAATDARDRYLAGKLSEEEALRIIHVPTIQELRETNSADALLPLQRIQWHGYHRNQSCL